ncbi:extradiol ring-cleavage dioxygenase [Polymorphum gilvum]|uniref:Extradiol ring-cleavage dioxygenase class III protein subunit B n=1 Tax=Polymorphum gilvum (strain LMG 25793 / CGMCC 1.9160 / SL003B-26A1) TaxID=991905 RepID=F2IZI2_POLGS|nr:extradiol ring-cleavage dioxygenase [Polymorphum gilvum]ADZ69539.1 Extradiol ring-cleavage dioxygenase class III protein subunit B [Polymorphum gilvum SL003B-26A1]
MARIVGGIGVPHTPYFPRFAAQEGSNGEINTFFGKVRADLEAHRPDVILMIDTDHFNTFYFDTYPTFAVGVDHGFYGPVDDVALMPPRVIRSHKTLALHLHRELIARDFDSALVTNFKVGHSVCVPFHFLTPGFEQPIIPIFLNGHLPPMPSARRAYAFGKALRLAILSWPEDIRVEVIGTGSFSLDVAGPKMFPGENYGVPDLPWAKRVIELMLTGDIETLLDEASEERMLAAGNVGGELLNWIAMIGAVANDRASWIDIQEIRGHAFGVWEAEE